MKRILLILICLLCMSQFLACTNISEQTTVNADAEATEITLEETTSDKDQTSEPNGNTSNAITEPQETETITKTPEYSTTETTETYITEATEDNFTEEITTEEVSTEEDKSAGIIIESSKTDLIPGEEFTLTISIKNNPGIFSFTFIMPIDNNVFEFVSSNTEDSLCDSFGICKYDETVWSYKFNGYGPSLFENLSTDGEVVTITLRVMENVVPGQYALSVNPDYKNIINVDGELVEFNDAIITLSISE